MKDKMLLILRIGVFYGGLLLGFVWKQAIGTGYFLKVIVFLATLMTASLVTTIILEKIAPKSLEARKVRVTDNRRVGVDKILLPLFQVITWISIAAIPLDIFIWKIFNEINVICNVLGIIMVILSSRLNFLSIYNNPYITMTIHDQSDRKQQVVSTGIYGIIRHPFYTSIILQLFGMSLWFGSVLSILFVLVASIVLIIRIYIEENYLKNRLPEYYTYIEKTKFRLIPYIW